MSTADWSQLKTVSPAYQLIVDRNLTTHLEELEAYGLAVLTPEEVGESEILERARAAVLEIADERTGVHHDIDTGAHGNLDGMGSNDSQYLLYAILEHSQVFEEIVQHRMTLPLIEYYLGQDCQLSSLTCFVKWSDSVGYGPTLGLHDDSGLYQVEPLPAIPHVFNTNWILTDYTKDNGAFCVVPGSHKLRRHPRRGEGAKNAVPVEAPAGSVLVFHGNLWHGAFPRKNPGLRLSLNAYYCGSHYKVQENFQGRISDEILSRNNERFRQLIGYDDAWGFTDERGPLPWRERKQR